MHSGASKGAHGCELEKVRHSSQESSPMESHTMHATSPVNCDVACDTCLPGEPDRDSVLRFFTGGWSRRHPLPNTSRNPKLREGKQVSGPFGCRTFPGTAASGLRVIYVLHADIIKILIGYNEVTLQDCRGALDTNIIYGARLCVLSYLLGYFLPLLQGCKLLRVRTGHIHGRPLTTAPLISGSAHSAQGRLGFELP